MGINPWELDGSPPGYTPAELEALLQYIDAKRRKLKEAR